MNMVTVIAVSLKVTELSPTAALTCTLPPCEPNVSVTLESPSDPVGCGVGADTLAPLVASELTDQLTAAPCNGGPCAVTCVTLTMSGLRRLVTSKPGCLSPAKIHTNTHKPGQNPASV